MPGPLDWSALYARYRALAVRFAEGLVGRRELAEDLVQEAFRSVLERARAGEVALDSEEHARNYLFRALRNLAVDALRSPRARGVALEEPEALEAREPSAEGAALAREERALDGARRARVERTIAGLRAPEREALALRYGDSLTYREMAERTGESISTLQGRVEAALEKIRRKIGKEVEPS